MYLIEKLDQYPLFQELVTFYVNFTCKYPITSARLIHVHQKDACNISKSVDFIRMFSLLFFGHGYLALHLIKLFLTFVPKFKKTTTRTRVPTLSLNPYTTDLRIDNGDLGAMWPQWCVFSDKLIIYHSIRT